MAFTQAQKIERPVRVVNHSSASDLTIGHNKPSDPAWVASENRPPGKRGQQFERLDASQ